MSPVLINLGPFTLHTYGFFVALGFVVGYLLARRAFERQGLPEGTLDRIVYLLLLGGLFGSRLFYVGFVGREHF
ncbi:hypothetical protein BVX98_02515, partial [bacterium F11]